MSAERALRRRSHEQRQAAGRHFAGSALTASQAVRVEPQTPSPPRLPAASSAAVEARRGQELPQTLAVSDRSADADGGRGKAHDLGTCRDQA